MDQRHRSYVPDARSLIRCIKCRPAEYCSGKGAGQPGCIKGDRRQASRCQGPLRIDGLDQCRSGMVTRDFAAGLGNWETIKRRQRCSVEVAGNWVALDPLGLAERNRLHGIMLHHYALFWPFPVREQGLDAKGDLVRL